jgi:hypothetical protein
VPIAAEDLLADQATLFNERKLGALCLGQHAAGLVQKHAPCVSQLDPAPNPVEQSDAITALQRRDSSAAMLICSGDQRGAFDSPS